MMTIPDQDVPTVQAQVQCAALAALGGGHATAARSTGGRGGARASGRGLGRRFERRRRLSGSSPVLLVSLVPLSRPSRLLPHRFFPLLFPFLLL